MDDKDKIKNLQTEARTKQLATRALVDSAFPSPGPVQPNHEGSQSTSPNKDYP